MITRNDIFDRVCDAILAYDSEANVTAEPERAPASFPTVWVIDINWRPEERYTAIDLTDEQVRSNYEVQAFSAKDTGAFLEARDLIDVATAAFRELGYRCTYNSPVDNYEDETIARRVARYQRMIGGGDTLPTQEP